jgi:3-hydroxybutyryl-CoA dehydrogenase
VTKEPEGIHGVAVIGGGYMGGGIAQAFALGGLDVVLVDASPDRTRAAVDRVAAQLVGYESDGLIAGAAEAAARIVPGSSITDAVRGAGYVTEAVPESLGLKRQVLAQIAAAAAPHAIIATNTSAIPLELAFEGLDGRDRFLAAHWFNPAPFVPLVELAGGSGSAIACADALLRRIGKVPVRVPAVPGFLSNRLQLALYREAALIVEEGLADAGTVDELVTNSFGMRLPFFGPLLVGDIAGLDVYAAAFASLQAQYGERFAAPASLVERVAAGDLGVKTGRGLRGTSAIDREDLERLRDRAFAGLNALREGLGASGSGSRSLVLEDGRPVIHPDGREVSDD